jgi:hypothetical protein
VSKKLRNAYLARIKTPHRKLEIVFKYLAPNKAAQEIPRKRKKKTNPTNSLSRSLMHPRTTKLMRSSKT